MKNEQPSGARYMKNFIWLLFSLLPASFLEAQDFDITIEPIAWSPSLQVQSFAWASHQGKWLIIGGRTDGLHRRQPFASFSEDGQNKMLTVIDPEQQKTYYAPLTNLRASIAEQFSATNPVFYQDGNQLLLAGGYGYSNTAKNHITHPYLTLIDVPAVINAIENGKDPSAFIRQVKDDAMAVTGGALKKIDNVYFLTGGQKFTGRYNPHGPDHGPGFEQVYTNAIRRFLLFDSEKKLLIQHAVEMKDSLHLHRRDFNVVPQIMPDGSQGLTAFSGVFQYDADLPYLTAVNIEGTHYKPVQDFKQFYNHYHCANLPLYDASGNQMHTIFFGGIAQYYDSAGMRKKDDDVPFVKTIARVTRHADGTMEEVKLGVEMPALLGAGSELILHENIPVYANGVVKLNALPQGKTELGYIFGGIHSEAPNVFWSPGVRSKASAAIFKVTLVKR